MQITTDSISESIPYYLTGKGAIVEALKKFPDIEYYQNIAHEAIWQGDGWTKFQVRNFETGELISMVGIVLTNTCDMDPENSNDLPMNITFSPIISLARYVEALVSARIPRERIASKIKAIQAQRVSTLFFLPKDKNLSEDCVATLNFAFTMPMKTYNAIKDGNRIFTLSQIGHYMLIFKLSVHFCRFSEELIRA